MNPPPNNTRTRRHTRSKELFLQERESGFDVDAWDGKHERENQRKAPSLPMKWHSNKWVDRLFS